MTERVNSLVSIIGSIGIMGLGISVWIIRTIDKSISRNVAIQTATLAELTGPNAPVVEVKNMRWESTLPGTDETRATSSPETYYVRADGKVCYLAIDGKAVLNTCYGH